MYIYISHYANHIMNKPIHLPRKKNTCINITSCVILVGLLEMYSNKILSLSIDEDIRHVFYLYANPSSSSFTASKT